MNTTNKFSLVLLGLLIGIVIISLFAYNNKPTNDLKPLSSNSKDSTKETAQSFYQVTVADLPKEVTFASNNVPVENIDVAEKLDREFMVNTFWHSQTLLLIKRANRWFPVIEPILKKNNIPDDFKYLAVIESGLDNVTSPSGAKGFWQFMKPTATGYNLEVSDDVDERYHLEKSTEAACKYLNSAYDIFNDWTLAAASYNMGKTGLQNKLDEQKVTNYYDLLLNIETGRYVYRIVAAKYILSNPKKYGFNLENKNLYPPYQTYSIAIDTTINNLVDFALKNKSNYKTLKLLNPWLRSNQLNASKSKNYTILLPNPNSKLTPITSIINE